MVPGSSTFTAYMNYFANFSTDIDNIADDDGRCGTGLSRESAVAPAE